jgi:Protein of unknown function (DUF3618).
MDENSAQIARHIERERERLGQNLHELEDKVRRSADWRTHFENHPLLAMGLALGGGMLLSALISGNGRNRHSAPIYNPWSQENRSAE